jgi:hypothetical protein
MLSFTGFMALRVVLFEVYLRMSAELTAEV